MNMKNALILHGTNADHMSNWFPWLKHELTSRGYYVWVPDLPHPDVEHFDIPEYAKSIVSHWKFDRDSVLVGHSGGSVVLLKILEELPKEIIVNKVLFVSGFTDDQGWPALTKYFSVKHDWNIIRGHTKKIILFHSDNDAYISPTHGKESQKRLNAELVLLPGCGHFNFEKGPKFKEFPELLDKILK
jgi:uncharacterized protein